MNIRNTMKALAVALPLAAAPAKMNAQATKITKGAQTVLTGAAKDSLKAVTQDPRTVSVVNYAGNYRGSVVNGKIGNGALNYAEKGKTLVYEANTKPNIYVGASVINADNLPSVGMKIHGGLEKNKNGFDVAFAYANKNGYSDMIANASYKRSVPLGSGFTAFGKVGADNIVRREAVKGGDHHGIITPNIKAGIKYDHKFANDVTIGATADVGGGPALYLRTDAGKTQVKRNMMYNAEGRVGYKHVEIFAEGGKDDVLGKQFGVGGRYKF